MGGLRKLTELLEQVPVEDDVTEASVVEDEPEEESADV
jgi:hypothetical protein